MLRSGGCSAWSYWLLPVYLPLPLPQVSPLANIIPAQRIIPSWIFARKKTPAQVHRQHKEQWGKEKAVIKTVRGSSAPIATSTRHHESFLGSNHASTSTGLTLIMSHSMYLTFWTVPTSVNYTMKKLGITKYRWGRLAGGMSYRWI